jgi:abelson tyrosine-protein kinase 1
MGWVPSNYIAQASAPEKNPWFHGKISRNAAEYNLRNGIDGSFLVRESESNPGENSISLRFEGKVGVWSILSALIVQQVYHYRVSKGPAGLFISKESAFPTMNELIEHHSKKADGLIVPLKVCQCLSFFLTPQHAVPKKVTNAASISKEMEDKWELDRNEITLSAKLGSGQYGEVYEGFWKKFNTKVRLSIIAFRLCTGRCEDAERRDV